jgi:hypothetical protein
LEVTSSGADLWTDGVAMILPCNRRSQDVTLAKAMKLSADDVKTCNKIIALDTERRTVALRVGLFKMVSYRLMHRFSYSN